MTNTLKKAYDIASLFYQTDRSMTPMSESDHNKSSDLLERRFIQSAKQPSDLAEELLGDHKITVGLLMKDCVEGLVESELCNNENPAVNESREVFFNKINQLKNEFPDIAPLLTEIEAMSRLDNDYDIDFEEILPEATGDYRHAYVISNINDMMNALVAAQGKAVTGYSSYMLEESELSDFYDSFVAAQPLEKPVIKEFIKLFNGLNECLRYRQRLIVSGEGAFMLQNMTFDLV